MQSRKASFIEAVLNTLIGYVISFIGQLYIYQAMGHTFTLKQNVVIGLFFMALSLARSYVIRRHFNGLLKHAAERLAA